MAKKTNPKHEPAEKPKLGRPRKHTARPIGAPVKAAQAKPATAITDVLAETKLPPAAASEVKRAKPPKDTRCAYNSAICEKIVALGIEGQSAPEIRRALGIKPSTWRGWMTKHDDFRAAVDEAEDAAQAWWIELGRKGVTMGNMQFNAPAFVYLTKNIFPKIFRDRQDHQFTGANDGPIVQEMRAPDFAKVNDREAMKAFEAFRTSLAIAKPAKAQ